MKARAVPRKEMSRAPEERRPKKRVVSARELTVAIAMGAWLVFPTPSLPLATTAPLEAMMVLAVAVGYGIGMFPPDWYLWFWFSALQDKRRFEMFSYSIIPMLRKRDVSTDCFTQHISLKCISHICRRLLKTMLCVGDIWLFC